MVLTRSMASKRPFAHQMVVMKPKRSRSDANSRTTSFTDLPQGVHECILDMLDGRDMYNSIVTVRSVATVVDTGLYGSKRLYSKYGERAFAIAASRAYCYKDHRDATSPGSVMYTLLEKYGCDVNSGHPKTGTIYIL